MSDLSVSTATSTATTTSSAAMSSLTEDFDQFLSLLVTQLENQSPLDPMDSSELTNQLVGFAQVEQQINTNAELENISSLLSGPASAQPWTIYTRLSPIPATRRWFRTAQRSGHTIWTLMRIRSRWWSATPTAI